jgi:hypothetical protein
VIPVKIQMLKTAKGSPDGRKVMLFEGGKEYDMPESLALVFAAEGLGELVPVEVKPKMMRGAPDNKAEADVPADKAETEEVKEPEETPDPPKSFKNKPVRKKPPVKKAKK